MTLGPLMVDLAGTALTEEERRLLQQPAVGGVILFARNHESPEQIRVLIEEIHSVRTPPLLVAVDQEGGRVQRFREGFSRLPPMGKLGELYGTDPEKALETAHEIGWLTAAELRAVGVDLDFAPVLDLDRRNCPVIGDRAFHTDPEVVALLAHAWSEGAREAGMQSVGKHFPGHGGVTEDSHLTLPRDERKYADLQLADLVPFERMIHQGMAGIMAAHIVFPRIAPEPAGFSPFWMKEVLRGELGFEGAIFSDDLNMEGARCAIADPVLRARRCLEAGADMVLICNAPEEARAMAEALSDYADPASALRLVRFHGTGGGNLSDLEASPRWQAARKRVEALDIEPWLDMDP